MDIFVSLRKKIHICYVLCVDTFELAGYEMHGTRLLILLQDSAQAVKPYFCTHGQVMVLEITSCIFNGKLKLSKISIFILLLNIYISASSENGKNHR